MKIVMTLIAAMSLFVVNGAFAAPAKTLPTRQEWQKRAGATATWPPARMSDDELQIWVDFLIEEGHSYGEYLSLRLQARHARDSFEAVGLLAAAQKVYHKHRREWLGDLPDASFLSDNRGLIRGLTMTASTFRDFAAAGGQQIYESKGFDWLGAPGGFDGHQLSDVEVEKLAQWHLTSLNLRSNNVTDVGAKKLAQSTTLKFLELTHNPIGDRGAIDLLRSKSIEALDVGGNNLSDAVLTELGSNHVLKRIDLNRNRLTDSGLRALEKNDTLVELRLGENDYTVTGVARLLRSNLTLKRIALQADRVVLDCQRNLTQPDPVAVSYKRRTVMEWWSE